MATKTKYDKVEDEEDVEDKCDTTPAKKTRRKQLVPRTRSSWCFFICACTITVAVICLMIGYMIHDVSSNHDHNNNNNNNHNGNNNGNEEISCEDKILVVIGFDGFRSLYLTDSEYRSKWNISTPNFDLMMKNGVQIEKLIPVFPTVTGPNFHSIVTGLYPKFHGIVANIFYDFIIGNKSKNDTTNSNKDIDWDEYGVFKLGKINDTKGDWYIGEPIWNTLKSSSNIEKYPNFQSASIGWYGGNQNCSGKGYPDFYVSDNDELSHYDRMDLAIDLINSNDNDNNNNIGNNDKYRLIFVYFDYPDETAHKYGPNSIETANKIMEMDGVLGYFLNKLQYNTRKYNMTDIIVLSDHGFVALNESKRIYINKSDTFNLGQDRENFLLGMIQPVFEIYITPQSNYTQDLLIEQLNNHIADKRHFEIYKNGDIPFDNYNYNYGYNNRIGDVNLIADLGYLFEFVGLNDSYQHGLNNKGGHGYDNRYDEMAAIFVAMGPSFAKNKIINQSVENIHLYSLFTHLLCDIEPSFNNGSLDKIKDVLNHQVA